MARLLRFGDLVFVMAKLHPWSCRACGGTGTEVVERTFSDVGRAMFQADCRFCAGDGFFTKKHRKKLFVRARVRNRRSHREHLKAARARRQGTFVGRFMKATEKLGRELGQTLNRAVRRTKKRAELAEKGYFR